MVNKFKNWLNNTGDKIKTSVKINKETPFFYLSLILIIVLAVLIRISPIIMGTFLIKEFDPWVQYTSAKYILENCGFPIPHGAKVHSSEEVKKVFKKLSKPVVIKPISEMWGKGITTNIMTLKEALQAFEIANQYKGDYVIMEEHIQGDDHRILFIGGKFIAGLKRTPPYIIGNGKDSILTLIEKENIQRKKSKKKIKKILLDETIEVCLKKQKLSLESIPEKNQKVFIRMTGNICSGGVSENITDLVHPSIIELGKEIISLLNLEIGGIDIITTDISKPLSETRGKISEVNQNPDIVMHTDPHVGLPIDSTGLFVKYLFPNSKDAWIDIDKNGNKIKTQKELVKHLNIKPKKVICFENMDYKNKIVLKNPKKSLLFYLLSNLTYSISI